MRPLQSLFSIRTPARWTVLAIFFTITSPSHAAEPAGEQIYKAKCASCHGATGEGGKKYKKRLEGDQSVAQLADVIAKTMPEDDPGTLTAKEAETVSAYIHDAFYSRLARERNRPARIELTRLTVRQYRHAVADLLSNSSQPEKVTGSGLKAEYFSGRRFNNNNRALERIDPHVQFDFGIETPVPEKIEPHEFSIRWNGSLLAPETGEYEFAVRTEHAARLWINEMNRPLIDAWVKSGNDTEYKATLFLIGGRVYPLRLEFTKAKQGVDDSNKQKEKPQPKPASIALLWKRPQRVLEPIPSRQLLPVRSSVSFICSTPFPPDDRSYGWERGVTISKAWEQATTDAAIEAAGYVVSRINDLAGTRTDTEKLRTYCRTFAERAFRRPLTETQKQLIDRQFTFAKDSETAVKRVVLFVLKSPHFLYREVSGGVDAFDVALRLSFGLWDSLPDQEIWNAAKAGQLSTKEQVAKQAERMLNDPRAKAKLRDFLLTWLKADHGNDVAKDMQKFPGFDPALIGDLRSSLEMFLDEVLTSEAADYRALFLSDELHVNSRLAKFYGVDLPPKSEFAKVKLDPGKRAGVLTHPYLMTSFAHSSESSPIHRGVFLARGVLGQSLRPPPEAVAPLAPELHPTLTTRERVILQTQSAACMSCHSIINPLGFTLEQFDAVGKYREKDHGKLIDASGSYRTRSGKTVKVNGARELATFIATSEEAHAAFVEQLFHHLVQQPMGAFGAETADNLRKQFAMDRFHIRKLAVEIMCRSSAATRGIATTKER